VRTDTGSFSSAKLKNAAAKPNFATAFLKLQTHPPPSYPNIAITQRLCLNIQYH
jgi:hypothetical protein